MLRAVVDLGTNSALLLVARVEGAGAVEVIEDRCTIVRLGQGVGARGCLAPEARARTLACLRGYVARARDLGVGSLRVVATAVLREARDAADFCAEVERVTGASVEVLSGEREAVLAHRGALSGLAVEDPVMVVDIGGGSTEITLGASRKIEAHASLPMGAVRMTERFLRRDPPGPEELAALDAAVADALARAAPPAEGDPKAVAVAGTATTLASIHLGLCEYRGDRVHGVNLTRARVEELAARLAAAPLADRMRIPGLDPGRADVIVAGARILGAVLGHYRRASVVVSDRGLRFGLLAEGA
jgi:exopolyphosphatase/guanosine-5'-triphosphate,3'-diphosphate pyrophosphatase